MNKLIKALCAFKPFITNPVIRFIIGLPLTIGSLQVGEYYQDMGFVFTFKILATLSVIIVYYFIILPVIGGMTGRIYTFHETKNAANLHRNPLKFAFKHRNKIIIFYKLFFIAGSTYALIMLWFF